MEPRPPLPADIPAEALPFLEEVGYLLEDPLQVGDPVPALKLFTPDGECVALPPTGGSRPAVLIFGSHT